MSRHLCSDYYPWVIRKQQKNEIVNCIQSSLEYQGLIFCFYAHLVLFNINHFQLFLNIF